MNYTVYVFLFGFIYLSPGLNSTLPSNPIAPFIS